MGRECLQLVLQSGEVQLVILPVSEIYEEMVCSDRRGVFFLMFRA